MRQMTQMVSAAAPLGKRRSGAESHPFYRRHTSLRNVQDLGISTEATTSVVAHSKTRHPELAKDLQSLAFHRRASSMERSAALRTQTPWSTQTVGDSSQAQNDNRLWLAVAWSGRIETESHLLYLCHLWFKTSVPSEGT